jgi:hypothetical protein
MISLKNEGSTLYLTIILIINNEKINLYSRLEYGRVIRYKNPLLYTLSYITFYLFYR